MIKRILSGLFKGKPIEVPKIDELAEGEARGVNVGDPFAGGTRVILCRVEGRVHAVDSLCPHQGGRIEPGKLVEGKYVTCPLHNYVFDPKDGKVMRGACAKATTYRVEEKGDVGLLYL